MNQALMGSLSQRFSPVRRYWPGGRAVGFSASPEAESLASEVTTSLSSCLDGDRGCGGGEIWDLNGLLRRTLGWVGAESKRLARVARQRVWGYLE